MRRHVLFLLLSAALALTACEGYRRLDRPLPPLQARGLDGTAIDRDFLAGRPWIINLWVPG